MYGDILCVHPLPKLGTFYGYYLNFAGFLITKSNLLLKKVYGIQESSWKSMVCIQSAVWECEEYTGTDP